MARPNRGYKIRAMVCDWALDIPMGDTTFVLYFSSRNNAELVKEVLEWEDAHPNEATPYQPTLTPQNEPLSILVLDEPDREYIDYICPRCKSIISQRRRGQRMETMYKCKFHDNCGQRVDWSNPQPYRRPPEGEEDK